MTPNLDTIYADRLLFKNKVVHPLNRGFISFDFSYQLGVIKTRPGFANEIAMDINYHAYSIFLGAVAINDTILLIPREGVARQEVVEILTKIIPGFKEKEKV